MTTPQNDAPIKPTPDPIAEWNEKRRNAPQPSPSEALKTLNENFKTLQLMQLNFRKSQIAAIKRTVKKYESQFYPNQTKEYNSPMYVSFLQLKMIYDVCDQLLENLNDWTAEQHVNAVLAFFPSTNFVKSQGKGVYCIFGSEVFPLSSVLVPMLYAIGAGNCCLIKANANRPECNKFLKEIAFEAFDPRFYLMLEGNAEMEKELREMKFDGFWYSGDLATGKHLMEKAGSNLVPTGMDLASKNPVIIAGDANLDVAARIVASACFVNGGLMPWRPDYVLCESTIFSDFKKKLVEKMKELWSGDEQGLQSPKMTNSAAWQKLNNWREDLKGKQLWTAGTPNSDTRFMPATIFDNPPEGHAVLTEPIIGPFITLHHFNTTTQMSAMLSKAAPSGCSAMYLFSKKESSYQTTLLQNHKAGTLIINDIFWPFMNMNMPAEGFGDSGHSARVGRPAFENFALNRVFSEQTSYWAAMTNRPEALPNPNKPESEVIAFQKKIGAYLFAEPNRVVQKYR